MLDRTLLVPTAIIASLLSACVVDTGDPDALLDEEAYEEDSDAIVGGTNQNIANHPWQISLQSSTGSHFCGGSVLNASWIVTAQHCIDGSTNYVVSAPASIRVAAGSTTLSGMASGGQIRQVDQVIPYPGYTTASSGKDVALLHLTTPLDLADPEVESIALATAADESAGLTNAGVTGNVSGWGSLSSGGSSPDTLQAVNVPIVSNAAAGSLYGMTITSDQLAAGDTANGGEDSCQGDSGGPFTVAKGAGRILAGVVSWGNGCAQAQYPGLYARVASFQPWIADVSTSPFTNKVNQSNQSGAASSWKHFSLTVAAGTQGLAVYLSKASSSSGDADLYVRSGSQPTTSAYTCRPYQSGHNEACVIPNPAAGTWYVSIRGYSAYTGVNLRADAFN